MVTTLWPMVDQLGLAGDTGNFPTVSPNSRAGEQKRQQSGSCHATDVLHDWPIYGLEPNKSSFGKRLHRDKPSACLVLDPEALLGKLDLNETPIGPYATETEFTTQRPQRRRPRCIAIRVAASSQARSDSQGRVSPDLQ